MKIDVIIPTYNGERTIERAINSIQNQKVPTGVKVNIIICDDCSEDQTTSIAQRMNAHKIYRNKRNSGGPNWGRNMGIKKSKADVIAFLDQDDEWLPDKLEQQIEKLNEGAELVGSWNVIRME